MNSPHRARKRFGQHFLSDGGIINDIVDAIAPRSDDILVEIGPGRGEMTQPLAASGALLHAIEFDRDLVAQLRTTLRDYDNVRIHEADALKFDFSTLGENLRVVGNLPYNISTPLLFHLMDFIDRIADLHLMLQKEVVDRMAAVPGTKSFGRLTVMLGCQLQVVPLFDVPPGAFSPPPKVMSSVVALRPLPPGTFVVVDPGKLSALLAAAFGRRRKTLRNALKGIVNSEQLAAAGIDPGLRPEQIEIARWVELANSLERVL